jgi:hypothetical protein
MHELKQNFQNTKHLNNLKLSMPHKQSKVLSDHHQDDKILLFFNQQQFASLLVDRKRSEQIA